MLFRSLADAYGPNSEWEPDEITQQMEVPLAASTEKATLRFEARQNTAYVSIHAFDPETGTFKNEPLAKSTYADRGVLQVTVPFPVDKDSYPYQVRVSNIEEDMSPRKYEITLVRKDNDLNVKDIMYNDRLAYDVRNTSASVELDADGNLVVEIGRASCRERV